MIPVDQSQVVPFSDSDLDPGESVPTADARNLQPDEAGVSRIAEAIKQIESGGDYNATSPDGGRGAYQFTGTWDAWSSAYAQKNGLGSAPLPMTPAYQDAVAKDRISGLVAQGYSPKEIASIWNCGHADWEGRTGVNAAGVTYNVPAYVAKFERAYNSSGSPSVISRVVDGIANLLSPTSAYADELHPDQAGKQAPEQGPSVIVDPRSNTIYISIGRPFPVQHGHGQYPILEDQIEPLPESVEGPGQNAPGSSFSTQDVSEHGSENAGTEGKPPEGVLPKGLKQVQDNDVDFFQGYKNIGLEAASAFESGTADFWKTFNDAVNYVSQKTGVGLTYVDEHGRLHDNEAPNLMTEAVNELQANAAHYQSMVKDPSLAEKVIGQAAGGFVPGSVSFAMGVPYAALKGLENGGVKGMLQEIVARYAMGKVLGATEPFKLPTRTALTAAAFGGETAARGGTVGQIAQSAATGGVMGLTSGPGGEMSARQGLEAFRESLTPDMDGLKASARSVRDSLPAILDDQRGAINPPPRPTNSTEALERVKSNWIGNKDYALHMNGVEAGRLQQQIMELAAEKRYGPKSKEIDKALQIYLDVQRDPSHVAKYFGKLSKEQQEVVRNAVKFQNDPGFLAIARQIRQSYDQTAVQALDAGVIRNVLDNYAARVWKPLDKKPATEQYRKFGTTTGHAKQRVFTTVLEGEAAGRQLLVEGATNNLRILKDEIAKTIEDKEVLKRLSKMRDAQGRPILINHPSEGYKRIEHPNFKVYRFLGKIDAQPIIETVRQFTQTVNESSTLTGGKGAPTVESKPVTRMKQVVKDSLTARGMTAGEADLYVSKIEQAARNGVDAIEESRQIIEKLVERTLQVSEKQQVTGVEFSPLARRGIVVSEDGTILQRQELYAPEDIAASFNKILGTSKLKGIGAIDAATRFNAQAKSILLTTSLFHYQSFMRQYLLGTHGISDSTLNPFKAYKIGLQAIQNENPILKELIKNGGLTLGRQLEWEEKAWTGEPGRIARAIDGLPGGSAARAAFVNLMERQSKFLFEKFGAGLKAQAAILEYMNSLKAFPEWTPQYRARMVSEYVNNAFGGLNLARLERDPTVQHIFRLGALAPDWTESNFNQFVKAFGTGDEGKLYRRLWASVIARGMTATIAANLLMSAFDDKSFLERYKLAWEAGKFRWLDVDITPLAEALGAAPGKRRYFGIFGQFTDGLNWILHTAATIDHKASPLANILVEALEGTDWKQDPFTTWQELSGLAAGGRLEGKLTKPAKSRGPIEWSQTPSFIMHQALSKLPIFAQNLVGYVTGQMDGFDALTKGVGLRTASVREVPDWEWGVRGIQGEEPHLTGPTEERRQQRQTEWDLRERLKGGQANWAQVDQAVKEGRLTEEEQQHLKRNLKLSDLQVRIKGLPVDQAVRAYQEVLTPEQRQSVKAILRMKIDRSRSLTAQQKHEFWQAIK